MREKERAGDFLKKVPLHPSKTFEGKGQATGIKIRNGFDSVKENSITHKRSRYFVLGKIKYCRLTFLSDVIVFSDKEKQPVKSFLARYLFIKITQTNISVFKLLCLQSEIKRSNSSKVSLPTFFSKKVGHFAWRLSTKGISPMKAPRTAPVRMQITVTLADNK